MICCRTFTSFTRLNPRAPGLGRALAPDTGQTTTQAPTMGLIMGLIMGPLVVPITAPTTGPTQARPRGSRIYLLQRRPTPQSLPSSQDFDDEESNQLN